MRVEATILFDFDDEDAEKSLKRARRIISMYDAEIISVEVVKDLRSMRQNRALHLWFTQLAEALNDAGYDIRKTIKPGVEISWSKESVKEYLFKPMAKYLFKKSSTTQLTSQEIDKVYDEVNRVVGERTGVHVPFPSIENMIQ